MSPATLTDLPPELILNLGRFVTTSDLNSMAQLSKSYRNVANTLLYRCIDIGDGITAYLCCRTLASPNNELVLLVRAFNFFLRNYYQWMSGPQEKDFWRWFLCSVQRMTNLQHYSCKLYINDALSLEIWAALCSKQNLRSLRIAIPSACDGSVNKHGDHIFSLEPSFTELNTFEFFHVSSGPIPPMYEKIFQRILCGQSKHLRHLCLYTRDYIPDVLNRLLPGSYTLPALKSLCISSSSYGSDLFWKVPNIHSLTLGGRCQPFPTGSLIPSQSFQCLEHYDGPLNCLHDIMNTGAPLRRIYIDTASIFLNSSVAINIDWAGGRSPSWSTLSNALKRFSDTFRSVTELCVTTPILRIGQIIRFAPYITGLKVLILYVENNPTHIDEIATLGPNLLSDMHHLRTFSILEGHWFPWTFSHAFGTFQPSVLKVWGECCPTLDMVSFTSAFSWSKVNGVWSVPQIVAHHFPVETSSTQIPHTQSCST